MQNWGAVSKAAACTPPAMPFHTQRCGGCARMGHGAGVPCQLVRTHGQSPPRAQSQRLWGGVVPDFIQLMLSPPLLSCDLAGGQ